MKRPILIVAMTALLVAGCSPGVEPAGDGSYLVTTYGGVNRFTSVEIDGCDYLVAGGPNPAIVHKGNCRRCAPGRGKAAD